MKEKEINNIVKQIETAIRMESGKWNNKRFGSIQAPFVRSTMLKNNIGMVCEKCLKSDRYLASVGRKRVKYCCPEHRKYYKQIVDAFYFKPYPYEEMPDNGEKEISIDHIIPIANGGLEFDRDNLQWMDLIENIRKSGGRRYSRRKSIRKLDNFITKKEARK